MIDKKITQKCSGGNIRPPRVFDDIADECDDKGARIRAWVFTVNNYTEENYTEVCNLKYKYLIVGREIGKKNGTPHLQGYIEFKDGKTFSRMKKLIPRAWLGIRKGTPEQASDYCKKDCHFFEDGTISKQGARQDLIELKERIFEGESVCKIAIENPILYHQYGRTLNYLEDLRMRKLHRSEMTQGYWIYGSTGTGKSEIAFENYSCDTHYIWKYDNGWNDGYCQQDTVIIDEFRGQIKFSELLSMCDKHPNCFISRRCREPLPFISKKVIITSSLHPKDVFKNLSINDSMDQLYRRFKIFCSDTDEISLN